MLVTGTGHTQGRPCLNRAGVVVQEGRVLSWPPLHVMRDVLETRKAAGQNVLRGIRSTAILRLRPLTSLSAGSASCPLARLPIRVKNQRTEKHLSGIFFFLLPRTTFFFHPSRYDCDITYISVLAPPPPAPAPQYQRASHSFPLTSHHTLSCCPP